MKIKTVSLLITTLLFAFQINAQEKITTQPTIPHPVVELDVWQVHTGDLSIEEVFSNDSNVQWNTETINHEWWEKNLVKWYKKEVTLPQFFAGKDIMMEFRIDPIGIILLLL